MTVSKKVLKQINKEEIKPLPKWRFLLKNYVIWSLFIINLTIGSIGAGIIFFIIVNGDLVNSPLYTIPFAWIVISICFIAIAVYNYKHSEKGYKYSLWRVMLANLLLSVVLGVLLFTLGISERINDVFSENIPIYNHTMDMRSKIWMRPDDGYLAGTIISVDEEKSTLVFEDLNNDKWTIDYETSQVRARVQLVEGEKIKIIGSREDQNSFNASDIRPWGNGRVSR